MLLIALGSLIGLTLALTGAGGGILAVPALTLGLGWSMTQASPVALLTVASAAAIGMISGLIKGHVRFRAALLISAVGIAIAPFGQHLALQLPERALTALFASVMLIIAVRVFRSDSAAAVTRSKTCMINTRTGRISWTISSFFKLSAIGLISGLTTGLLGVGGGFIVVPALLRCSNISMNGIVATSLMVITLIASGAAITALSTGQLILSEPAWLFIGSAAAGMLLGRQFALKIPERLLQKTFSILVTCVALMLFYRTMY